MPVDAEAAEVHILENEAASRDYLEQLWAEAMEVFRSGRYSLAFSKELQAGLSGAQQDFMQEDTQAGMVYAFLEDFPGDRVCSKLLWAEALGQHTVPAAWETRALCEIMNTGIASGQIKGWRAYQGVQRYVVYGQQRGWERIVQTNGVNNVPDDDDFIELTDDALDLPF